MLEVLVVGAGPSGLTLAIELARRGIDHRLIDIAPAPFAGSRGKGLQPRTLEIFDHLGIADSIVADGALYPDLRVHMGPLSFRRASIGTRHPATDERPYPNLWMLPQARTEAVLRERLALAGGAVEFGVGLVTFTQDEDGVSAVLTTGETVEAQYIVGCDGGRSTVRGTLALGLMGSTLDDKTSIVADVAIDGLDRRWWHVWRLKGGERLHLCPLPNSDLFQLQAPDTIAADGLEEGVRRITGRKVGRIAWQSTYRHNARAVERYRDVRAFLVGDAAHIHPPSGGQGLNTSVQDAWNLGWKLAWALRGGPQSVLDSYADEREPVAAHLIALTSRLYKSGTAERGELTNQMDQNYRYSALTHAFQETESTLPEDDPSSSPQAGDHVSDARLPGGGRLYDLLRQPVASQLSFNDGTRILVRPDGYIARITNTATEFFAGAAVTDIRMN
jgi:2-polyprenyl-6-methoxyphenol hydroxylase-like FAD-dependent oxidoreductase